MERIPSRFRRLPLKRVTWIVPNPDDLPVEGFHGQAIRREAKAPVERGEAVDHYPLLVRVYLVGHIVLQSRLLLGDEDGAPYRHPCLQNLEMVPSLKAAMGCDG